jgi:hypothetical protein
VLHGTTTLLLGMLSGVPMAFAITGGWGEDAVRAWRTAHLGVVSAGVMLLALAPALQHVSLGAGAAAWVVRALLAAAYAAAIGLPLGAASGVRGLVPGGPVANVVVLACNTVLALGSLAGAGLVFGGALRRLHGAPDAATAGMLAGRSRAARTYDDSLGAPG